MVKVKTGNKPLHEQILPSFMTHYGVIRENESMQPMQFDFSPGDVALILEYVF